MYNHEQKNRFLQTAYNTESTRRNFRGVFNSTAAAEQRLQIDIAEQTAEQLTATLKQCRLTTLNSAVRRIYDVGKYQQWCDKNGLATTLSAKHVDPATICITDAKMVGSPGGLQSMLDAHLLPERSDTFDNVYRLFFWCAFAGVPAEILDKLKAEHIMLDEVIIKYDRKFYRLDTYCHKILRKCLLDQKMYPTTENGAAQMYRTRTDSGYLFRGFRSASIDAVVLGQRVHKRAPELPFYDSIFRSGIFYRVFAMAKDSEHESVDFRFEPYRQYKARLKSKPQTTEAERRLQLQFQKEYLQWKQIFYGR